MTYQQQRAYYLMIHAENAWRRELSRMFGPRATAISELEASHGLAGSDLRELYDAYREARSDWWNSIEEMQVGVNS